MSDNAAHQARLRDLERKARECRTLIAVQQVLLSKYQNEIDYLTLEHGLADTGPVDTTTGRAAWCKITRSTVLAVQQAKQANPDVSFTEIGRALGISRATACQIANGTYRGLARIMAAPL